MTNVVVGMAWQTAQVALGIYLVLKDWKAVVICAAVVLIGTVILKYNWFDKLEDYPADLADSARENVESRAAVPVAIAS